jgi:dTDP-4-amino-4,6-dideoxygalactose transaminase
VTDRSGLPIHFKDRALGGFGTLTALSFHETKNVTCREGGALLFNDERYIERSEILREKGTNRAWSLRGQVDRYMG